MRGEKERLPFIVFPSVAADSTLKWHNMSPPPKKEPESWPFFNHIQGSEVTQRKDGEERMLGYYFSCLCFSLFSRESSWAENICRGLVVSQSLSAPSSWGDSSLGCSSRCSGNRSCRSFRSCRIAAAGKPSQKKRRRKSLSGGGSEMPRRLVNLATWLTDWASDEWINTSVKLSDDGLSRAESRLTSFSPLKRWRDTLVKDGWDKDKLCQYVE